MMYFKFSKPALEIYTANFVITNTTHNITVSHPAINETTVSNSTEAQPVLLTLVLPNTTIISSLAPTPSRQLTASATVYADSPRNGRFHNGAGKRATRNPRIDLEKVKFRIVFILWPAMVGTLMAL
jgi:hypothetical protein